MSSSKYDFILDSGVKSKLPKIPSAGVPKGAKMLLLAVGGLFVLIIGIVLVSSIFFSAPYNSQLLAGIGGQQARILQAAEMGVESARSQEARNFATTIRVSLVGDQAPLLEALNQRSINASTAADPEVEERLTTAEQANRFDEELINYLQTELASYVRNLETAFNSTDDPALKEVLATQYKNAQLLVGESSNN